MIGRKKNRPRRGSPATTEILDKNTVTRIRKNSSIKKALFFAVILVFAVSATAQTGATMPRAHPQPLVLTGAVPLANIQGRIDHLGVNHKGRLFLSALGNNSEEIIDLGAGRVIHSISIPRPQGVAYAAASNELFVGSDEGKLYIYKGESLELITSIDFGDDVDNLRYDAAKKLVYVAYGDDEAGALAVIDATTNKRLEQEYKLGAHPESFQLETAGPNIYVNLPDLKQIAVIDRGSNAITRWPLKVDSNFPMALDEAGHTLFVVTHAPALLLAFDTTSGRQLAALPTVQNSDDVFFDAARKRIYVPGGEGSIDVFQRTNAGHYAKVARIPTAVGGRTGGYFGKGRKGFEVLYVAVPARADHGAEVLLYTVQD
jgi:DNA-binding beta-propeller fold protein YncE